MNLMTDPVARWRKIGPVAGSRGLQEEVVVRITGIGLQGIMIHIGNRQGDLDPRTADGLKLQIDHGPRGILGQDLVHL